jgi:peptidoglycan L-alanyl-D-glutamate endopeptidase CwlK
MSAMSAPLFPDDIKFLQRMLTAAGCYSGPADGEWSRAVDEGDAKLLDITSTLATVHGTFDERSERHIRSLHPKAQEAARRFLNALGDAGVDARIISGTRTYAEQEALFRIGRFGDTRPRVTNAKGGESNHNFGIAWDIAIFERGRYLTHGEPYAAAAKLRPSNVEWGGNWTSFPDAPHFQLGVNRRLADIRACFENGLPFVTA